MHLSLAESLKSETKALHTELERSSLMRSLLRGEMNRALYCALLRNLHALYGALESALRHHATHPGVAPLCVPALFRSQALTEDLIVLHGTGWAVEIEACPAAHRYVARLEQLAAHDPVLLVAHAYVRYLGDLSGGQALRRIVAKSLGPSHGQGTAFYDFGSPAEVAALAAMFRAGLSAGTTDPVTVAAIAAEARLAFRLHRDLFDELAVGLGDPPRGAAKALGQGTV